MLMDKETLALKPVILLLRKDVASLELMFLLREKAVLKLEACFSVLSLSTMLPSLTWALKCAYVRAAGVLRAAVALMAFGLFSEK